MLVVPRVFVSSTKVDLEDYRAAIAAQLPRLEALFCGMELFGAHPAKPQQTMLGRLATCDVFIGILGHRYGSENEEGISYTELEYRKAREAHLPVYMFVADESYRIDPNLLECDEKRRKLARFKREVNDLVTAEKFGSPEDLALKVSHTIQQWLEHTKWSRGEVLIAATLPSETVRRNIGLLYSDDEKVCAQACEALAGSRQAVEHFYALVRLRKDSDLIRQAVFKNFRWVPAGCQRVEQILEEFLLDNDVRLRRGAAEAICNRARAESEMSQGLVVPVTLVNAVLKKSTDDDEHVRFEIAHALPKIASRVPDRAEECLECLRDLETNDPSTRVRGRATQSLLDMGHCAKTHAASITGL